MLVVNKPRRGMALRQQKTRRSCERRAMVSEKDHAALQGVAGTAFSSVLTLDADTIASRK